MKADILSRKDHINTMEDNKETNNSRNRNDMRKSDSRRNHNIRRNTKEQNERTRCNQEVEKRRWTIMER